MTKSLPIGQIDIMKFSRLSQIAYETRSLLRGYPDFVITNRAQMISGHVPVFCYHTVEPNRFEQDLCFLAENGYRTLDMDELIAVLSNDTSKPDRSVVLTFDDARSSFWRYAYPLLHRYRMKGVLFVIAGLTTESSVVRMNLNSAWNGQCTEADIEALDPTDSTLCTWPELREMYASGTVQIESHSLFHREVFIDNQPIGYFGPQTNYVSYQSSITTYLSISDIGYTIEPKAFYGLPLFRTAPLHQGLPAWLVPPEVRDEAREVFYNAWREFGKGKALQGTLQRRWKEMHLVQRLRRQTTLEMERDIEEDIIVARDMLKEYVDRNAGEHFCLPFSVGSDVTVRMLKRNGIKSCSWGVLPGKKYNRPGDDPLNLCRIKADFLWRLPGQGRSPLLRVYTKKMERRMRGELVY